MPTKMPLFNKDEIGNIFSLRLQRTCFSCPKKQGISKCPIADNCPVGIARKILGLYLFNEEQVVTFIDPAMLPDNQPGAVYINEDLAGIFSEVHDLCKSCMFHTEKCFVNVMYMLIEIALNKQPRKASGTKPSEINI
jgi:hypothetical protein